MSNPRTLSARRRRTSRSAYVAPAAVGLLIALSGFGALLFIWTVGSWRSDVPGLFDYRSATIGDGFLLPLLAGCLVAGLRRLPTSSGTGGETRRAPTSQRQWTGLAVVVGLLLGAGTQALWLGDPAPRRNWSFPAAHEFNFAGWYHAVFLTLACSALTGLTVAWARKLRAAARSSDFAAQRAAEAVARSPWLGVAVGAAVTLGATIALDNDAATSTTAGTTTAVAVVAGAVVSVAITAWALDGLRRLAAVNIALGVVAGGAATALAADGLSTSPGIAAISVISAVCIGAAVTEPLRPPALGAQASDEAASVGSAAIRPLHIVTASLVLLGSLALAFRAMREQAGIAVLLVFLAPAVAMWIGRPEERTAASSVVAWISAVYGCGTLVLAAWIASRGDDPTEAGYAANIALGSIDLLAFALVKRRFGELGAFERAFDRSPDAKPEVTSQQAGPYAWIQVVGFAVPALFGLAALLAVAAPGLGLDDYARGSPGQTADIVLALLLAIPTAVVAAIVAVVGGRRRRTQLAVGLPLEIPLTAVLMSLIAAATWAVVVLGAVADAPRYPVVAAIAALIAAAMSAEDVVRTGASLHLARPGARGFAVGLASALTSGVAVYWLLSSGLWSGDRPAEVGPSVVAALAALGGALAINIALSVVVGSGLRTPVLTAQHPTMNLIMAHLQYVPLFLVAAAVPVALVGRVVDADLPNPGLVAMAAVFNMVGIGAIIAWIMQNLWEHLQHERRAPPPPELVRVAEELTAASRKEGRCATQLNKDRRDTLRDHIYWQYAATGFLVVAGLGWVIQGVT